MSPVNFRARLSFCLLAGLLLLALAPMARAASIKITDFDGRQVMAPVNPQRTDVALLAEASEESVQRVLSHG